MAKTILIATIIAGIAIILLFSSQEAYAPFAKKGAVAFSFSGGVPDISMTGQGAWKKGGQIGAGGSFAIDINTFGPWHAVSLGTTTCGDCSSQTPSGTNVAFTAEFNPRGSAPSFTAEVIIGSGADNTKTPGTENIWVEGFGFGNAMVTFNPAPKN